MSGSLAPIAVFVYNRPQHTKQMLLNLQQCDWFHQSPLYVFCDGPKIEESETAISEARRVVHELVGSHATIVEAHENMGLANSIIKGVTELCEEYGRVIVLEDDLIVSPIFLSYMNSALRKYESENSVMQISGHMFNVPDFDGQPEALFLPFISSWGWATWTRAWEYFDPDSNGYEKLKVDRNLRLTFNLGGAFDYYSMLTRQIKGGSDSWAIRWYWSVFNRNGLVLYPPLSLVQNTGFDGSGTHGWRKARSASWNKELASDALIHFPDTVSVDADKFDAVKSALRRLGSGVFIRICRSIMHIFFGRY